MSLREKAREVKAAGEEARGDFTPTGAPLRAYKYWASRSKNVPDKENFCHFWRVVVFWAPFMAFRRGVENLFSNTLFLGFVAIVALVGILLAGLTWTEFGTVVLIILGIGYGLAGLLFGAVYASERYKHDSWKPKPADVEWWDWNGRELQPQVDPISKWGAIATFPTSWFTYLLTSVSVRLDKGTKEAIGTSALVVLMGAVAIVLLVTGFIELGWAFLLVLGAIVLGLATLFGVVVGLGHVFESLRAYSKQKAANRPVKDPLDDFEAEPKAPREPGKVNKFFSGIADFLVLAAQVVRVNKWKICPLVTIDDTK